MLTVSEHRDLSAIATIRELWRALWWKTPHASFFQSVEWFERHCRRMADVHRPCVFVVAVEGRPVGLVPWIEKTVRGRVGQIRLLTDPLADQGFSCGPVGCKPEFTLQAALDHARADNRWDLLELRHIVRDRRHKERARRLDPPQTSPVEETRVVVECRGDWVRYLRSLPDVVREEYQSSERALAARGRLDYVRYRPEGDALNDGDPRWELFREVESGEFGHDAGLEGRRSLRAMHATAAAIAGVDLNLLRLDGKPLAWAYNYRCDGRIEVQRFGTAAEDSSAARCVLLGRMLGDGFRRGDERYLFDRETSRTAGGWQTGCAVSCRRLHYPRHAARARLVRLRAGSR